MSVATGPSGTGKGCADCANAETESPIKAAIAAAPCINDLFIMTSTIQIKLPCCESERPGYANAAGYSNACFRGEPNRALLGLQWHFLKPSVDNLRVLEQSLQFLSRLVFGLQCRCDDT